MKKNAGTNFMGTFERPGEGARFQESQKGEFVFAKVRLLKDLAHRSGRDVATMHRNKCQSAVGMSQEKM